MNVSDHMKKNVLCLVGSKRELVNAEQQAELMRYLTTAQNEVMKIMAMGSFPRFLKSKGYLEYHCSKRSASTHEEDTDRILRAAEESPSASTVSAELSRLLSSGSWLPSLIAAAEFLPVCITVADASSERRGFPLIYTNAYFEKITGYACTDIVGRNCKFLQADKAELDSIERISTALRDAQPVRVAITNVRKDGTPFLNLLALKPIFDQAGVYRYVVGMQFDATQSDATPAKLKIVDELLKVLPDTIPA